MTTRYANWILGAILLLCLSAVPGHAGHTSVPIQWPVIKPITKNYDFQDASRAAVNLVLDGLSGMHLYTLHCRAGLLGGISGEEADFNADFDCHLHSLYSRDRYQSLLIDNPLEVVEAHSRGEIWARDVQGRCGEYPEWGRIRNFKLRGMIVKFEMSDMQFASSSAEEPKLLSFKFKVEAIQDPTALSSIAEPPPFFPPWEVFLSPSERLRCDGEPLPQHVPGIVTAEYVRSLGLNPPFASVARTTTTLLIDASDGEKGPDSYFTMKPVEPAARFARAKIRAPNGNVVYEFECAAYRVPGGAAIAGDGLSCGLFTAGNATNLLRDSVEPYTRMSPSIILPRQLYGQAGAFPEWGNTRRFKLRGFLLTLKMTHTVFAKDDFGNPALVRSEVTLEVEPDATADTPVAEPPCTPFREFLPPVNSIPKSSSTSAATGSADSKF